MKPCEFNNVTRRMLRERLMLVKQGITPKFTDIRHFFYECRNIFLRENPNLTEIDSNSRTIYADFQTNVIDYFCRKHSGDFDIPEELYWRLREMMNIWAEPKAVCEGDNTKFLIDRDTRTEVGKNCSFILVCEKKTVSRELLEELGKRGYKVHLVSSGGQSVSDAHEALIEAIKDVEKETPNFYILVLHDYDLSGVTIYYNLLDRIDSVIDVGVTRDFFKQLPKTEWQLVEEQRQNARNHPKLKKRIECDEQGIYSSKDFDYLQGKLTLVTGRKGRQRKIWKAHRIEIDAIHVQYGITPFVDYIEKRIQEECKYWDLTRIGVQEFELKEPENPFADAVNDLEREISEKQFAIQLPLVKPLRKVEKLVSRITAEFLKEYFNVCAENGMKQIVNEDGKKMVYYRTIDGVNWEFEAMTLNREDFNALKREYEDGFGRKYAPEFSDKLETLNKRVHFFEGDIKKAIPTIEQEARHLQDIVDNKANNDEEAERFTEELSWIDWGEDEFDSLKAPDEKEVIKRVITKLKHRLDELEKGDQ